MSDRMRDILERAAWTAAQSALAVLVAAGTGWLDVNVWKAAGIAGVAAGLSALKTSLIGRTSTVEG